MTTYISIELRRIVIERAGNCCEYCLQSQTDSVFSYHIEHVIAEKHRGQTVADNLCLSCPECNSFKGSDIASLDIITNQLTALFNPRQQNWHDHFQLQHVRIVPKTAVGRVTEFLLQFNHKERLLERATMLLLGTYPCKNLI